MEDKMKRIGAHEMWAGLSRTLTVQVPARGEHQMRYLLPEMRHGCAAQE